MNDFPSLIKIFLPIRSKACIPCVLVNRVCSLSRWNPSQVEILYIHIPPKLGSHACWLQDRIEGQDFATGVRSSNNKLISSLEASLVSTRYLSGNTGIVHVKARLPSTASFASLTIFLYLGVQLYLLDLTLILAHQVCVPVSSLA